ncbi:MAG TPA: HEAT repeat domain-containing protein [Usitatibacter sp.]|nr:HEAT repeat domain-containing protein [Usitatibacter sp.]
MSRALVFALAFAALPAAAFDLESWAEKLMDRQMESWKKDRIETIARDPDPRARLEAIEGLPSSDPDACMAFAGALSDRDAAVRKAAADQLWRAGKLAEPYRPQLTKALEDADVNVVASAAGALQSTGVKEPELVAARKRVLAAPEASVSSRFFAARGLVGHEAAGRLVGPMVVYLERNTQRYTGSIMDDDRHNVELAENALERLVKVTKDRTIIAALMQALRETRNGQIPLLKTLGHFEPRPDGWTRALLDQLGHPNARVRYEALDQLGRVKQEKEVAQWAPRAAQMLRDPDPSVRANAARALGNATGLAAGQIEHVVAAASDPDASVRRAAVRALGEIAEANQAIPAATRTRVATAARPAIDKAMQDEDEDVRREAKDASRNMAGESGAKLAVAAPATPAGSEAAGLAILRSRKTRFDEQSWFLALDRLDVELVRAFLDAGMSPNAPVSGMGPPMRVMLFGTRACSPGVRPTRAETKAIVKLLLERGADVKGADGNGNTAISEAAGKGCDRELIRTLIKAGADINATNVSGLTPFEIGLWSGHDGLEELIAAGYRLPPQKVKTYLEGYKDRPAAVALVRKAAARK